MKIDDYYKRCTNFFTPENLSSKGYITLITQI